MANGSTSLPYTGTDVRSLVVLGTLLVLTGGVLLTSVESRRRRLVRTAAFTVDHVKDGARRSSDWFLGR